MYCHVIAFQIKDMSSQCGLRLNFIIIICLQTTPSTVELNVLLYLSITIIIPLTITVIIFDSFIYQKSPCCVLVEFIQK